MPTVSTSCAASAVVLALTSLVVLAGCDSEPPPEPETRTVCDVVDQTLAKKLLDTEDLSIGGDPEVSAKDDRPNSGQCRITASDDSGRLFVDIDENTHGPTERAPVPPCSEPDLPASWRGAVACFDAELDDSIIVSGWPRDDRFLKVRVTNVANDRHRATIADATRLLLGVEKALG